MKKSIFAASLLVLTAATAHAGTWRVGPGISYASGLEDVGNLYEKNYNNTHTRTQATVDILLPIGLGVQGTYEWDSGMRADLSAGPLFLMRSSDHNGVNPHLDHTEFPVSATLGYTFLHGAAISPYVRAGFVHHFVDGTYARTSTPGLLAAAGIEFARASFASYSFEVATDRSEVEFDRYRTTYDTVKLNTYDIVVSFIVKFGPW